LAIAIGIVLLNVNVTSAGDPLSGGGLSAGPTSAGITETGRVVFYGVLAVTGAVLVAAGMIASAIGGRAAGATLIRTFAFVAAAGVAGLLFDYRDGPQRLIHLIAYTAVAIAAVRVARLAVGASTEATTSPDSASLT
jgi:hypothetical protein